MLLRSEQLAAKLEQANDLGGESLGFLETLGEENDFRDHLNVRCSHGHGSEELLEIVW